MGILIRMPTLVQLFSTSVLLSDFLFFFLKPGGNRREDNKIRPAYKYGLRVADPVTLKQILRENMSFPGTNRSPFVLVDIERYQSKLRWLICQLGHTIMVMF